MKECLSGGYLLEEYRPDLIKMVVEKLTPENIRYFFLYFSNLQQFTLHRTYIIYQKERRITHVQ